MLVHDMILFPTDLRAGEKTLDIYGLLPMVQR